MEQANRVIKIKLPDGNVIDLTMADDDPKGFQARLQSNYKSGHATCLCASALNARRLKICRRQLANRETYYLARYPRTGTQHSERCEYHESDARRSGRTAYEPGVVREVDGHYTIRLESSLSTREPLVSEEAKTEIARRRAAGEAVGRMRHLGLLHLLWETAGLNVWEPYFRARRTDKTAAFRLQQAAEAMTIAKIPLHEIFIVLPRGRQLLPAEARALTDRAEEAQRLQRRLLVLGDMHVTASCDNNEWYFKTATHAGFSIPLGGMVATTCARRFPIEVSLAKDDLVRNMGLAIVTPTSERTRGGNRVLKIDDLVLMSTTIESVPVASSYELLVARKLIDEGRAFRKPLRFDAANEQYLADFELRDVGDRAIPLEVFGRTDIQYRAHASTKAVYYREVYGANWWAWDATESALPPPFPPSY